MELYVVHALAFSRRGGAGMSCVVGAYTDPDLAKKVATVVHGSITKVTVDHVFPGHLQAIEELYGDPQVG